jgi:hypothetical protein
MLASNLCAHCLGVGKGCCTEAGVPPSNQFPGALRVGVVWDEAWTAADLFSALLYVLALALAEVWSQGGGRQFVVILLLF